MKIGNTEIKNGILLAPMAGYTDRAMRLIAKEYGCEYSTTEMVSAKAVTYGDKKTFTLGRIYEDEGPVSLQLFGSDPAVIAEAGGIILEHERSEIARGVTRGELQIALPHAFDINMGCPVNKIFSNGEGSALMKDPDIIFKITKALSSATPLPVTVKMRLGIDEGHINLLECAKAAEEGGARAICIHGRTRVQMYGGAARREHIYMAKKMLNIPVIANGDIKSGDDAISMLKETGADAIAIGRGAVGNPFIFDEVRCALEKKSYQKPDGKRIIDAAIRQLQYAIKDKGEAIAIPEARKQIALYLSAFKGAKAARVRINSSGSYSEVEKILLSLCENEDFRKDPKTNFKKQKE